MAGEARPEPGPVAGPLDERILRALAQRPGHLAFNGLRRALAAHPESLTRSLRRLERSGTVGRDAQGYFLKERSDLPAPPQGPVRAIPLASVRLPFPIPPEAVLGVLAGRWFGPLRWVGLYDDRRPPALVWAIPGVAGQLVLQVKGGQLRVQAEGEGLEGAGAELVRGSEELLWNVLGRLRSIAPMPPPVPPVGDPRALALSADPPEPSAPGWAG